MVSNLFLPNVCQGAHACAASGMKIEKCHTTQLFTAGCWKDSKFCYLIIQYAMLGFFNEKIIIIFQKKRRRSKYCLEISKAQERLKNSG